MSIDVKDFGVFSFDVTNTDYEALLYELARKMRARVCGHQLILPPDFGEGVIQYLRSPMVNSSAPGTVSSSKRSV